MMDKGIFGALTVANLALVGVTAPVLAVMTVVAVAVGVMAWPVLDVIA